MVRQLGHTMGLQSEPESLRTAGHCSIFHGFLFFQNYKASASTLTSFTYIYIHLPAHSKTAAKRIALLSSVSIIKGNAT